MKMFFNFLLSQLLSMIATTFNYRSLPSMRRVNKTKFLLKIENNIENELLRCKSSTNPFDWAKIPYLEKNHRQFEATRRESRREAEEARRENERKARDAKKKINLTFETSLEIEEMILNREIFSQWISKGKFIRNIQNLSPIKRIVAAFTSKQLVLYIVFYFQV